ncbi:MAG: response regulator [Myxococcota bacterium]|nr:response regulator [Myxococcota bacterium]
MTVAPPTILVVDDERASRMVVSGKLQDAGMRVIEASGGYEGWEKFISYQPDLVVSDLRMDGCDGLRLLGLVRAASQAPFVMLSSFGDVDCAVAAMKNGAQDFIEFPKGVQSLPRKVRSLIPDRPSRDWLAERLQEAIPGSSSATLDLRRTIETFCRKRPAAIVVEGEPGSGRSHVIRTIHQLLSGTEPLERVDCRSGQTRALPTSGVIYLDDISALPRHDQLFVASLIERAADTSGGGRIDNIRICASVVGDVRSSGLETSLLRHFEGGRIQVPNLEARRADIPALAAALCEQISLALGGEERIRLTDEAMKALTSRVWEKNLHEMNAVLEKAVQRESGALLSEGSILLALEETALPSISPREQRDRNQKEELQWLIEETGCNVSEISRRLNLSRGAIYYRANKFGLEIG